MNAELEPLLRSLPRERASEQFTPRVLAKARARGREPRRAPARLAFAGAAAALVLTLAGLAGWLREGRADERRLAALRAEQARIERELHEIKEITAELEPVVYVGSSQEYDYYIDLRQVAGRTPAAQPASYRGEAQPGI